MKNKTSNHINSQGSTYLKIYLLEFKDSEGFLHPLEIASNTLQEAINYVEKEKGWTFVTEIKLH